jgi:hypothetical protein
MTMPPLFPDLRHLHSGGIPRMTRMASPIPPVGTDRRARVPADFRLNIGARARQKSSGIVVQRARERKGRWRDERGTEPRGGE